MENYISILTEAHKRLTSSEKTISVKDLTLCHRKKVFRIIDPIPMTNEELYDYVSGQAAHEVMEKLFMMYPDRFRTEMEVQYKNIKGKVDVFDKNLNNVIDTKTSKAQTILLKPFKFHREQVRNYMAMTDSEEGYVIYQMNNFGKYIIFLIHMTSEDRKAQLKKLEVEATSLLNAIDTCNPSLVKGIYEDQELKWLCNKCPYLQKCNDLRRNDAVGAAAA
jgi:hypothetical protein